MRLHARPHMHAGSAGGEQSNAGVGQHVHTERAQSLHERHCPLQGHLLFAADKHCVQALQHDSDVVTWCPWKTAGSCELTVTPPQRFDLERCQLTCMELRQDLVELRVEVQRVDVQNIT